MSPSPRGMWTDGKAHRGRVDKQFDGKASVPSPVCPGCASNQLHATRQAVVGAMAASAEREGARRGAGGTFGLAKDGAAPEGGGHGQDLFSFALGPRGSKMLDHCFVVQFLVPLDTSGGTWGSLGTC